jgi:hypothetical protein
VFSLVAIHRRVPVYKSTYLDTTLHSLQTTVCSFRIVHNRKISNPATNIKDNITKNRSQLTHIEESRKFECHVVEAHCVVEIWKVVING